MSDWDDLFRAAAGDDDDVEPYAPKMEIQTNPRKHQASTSPEKRPCKKKKKTRIAEHHTTSQELLESVLESRTDSIDQQIWSKIPAWLSPGSSLCNSSLCSRWEQDNDCLLDSKCKNCERTMLHHSVVVTPYIAQSSAGEVLTAFALVRDIRCCCSSILNEAYECSEEGQDRNPNIESYTITALKKSNRLVDMNFSSILPPGEADILIGKFNMVKHGATALMEKRKHWFKGKQEKKRDFKLKGIFDEIVQLIIYCDAVYFRMYYLQNSGNLPITNEKIFLPHPPTYFGSKNVAWDAFDHTMDLAKSMKKKCTQISDKRWDDLMQELGVNQSSSELDSLSFMHKNRLSESILIFHKSSWINSEEAKKKTMKSINHKSKPRDREDLFYITHETPAPVIVKEWRDSCRDLLCNLYAYATISPRIIHDIKEILRKNPIACKRVVEMGAGTGYIANLLCKAGLSVSAFDVAPTKRKDDRYGDGDTSNEYHGSSPPFCRVEYADSKSLQSIFGKREAKETALLLCYPPPLSDMAEDSLKSFVKQGGKTIIHIGEFSGLTGSSQFERFLSRRFDLKYRTPCLNWGSDTAEVTIWVKCEELEKSCPTTLVQCSQCKHVSATSRCRVCRRLSYCKLSCFDAHKDERGVHFAFNMIPDIINANDMTSFSGFGREKYFESMPCKYDSTRR